MGTVHKIALSLLLSLSLMACSTPGQTASPTTTPPTASSQVTEQTSETTSSEASFASWSQGSASLELLTDFVEAATTEGSKGFIPVEDRVAVFDLDGTLMCETYPWCFEYMVFADYALNNPSYQAPDDVMAVAKEIVDSAWGEKPSGMSTRQAAAAAVAYAGLTPAELEEYVTKFKQSEAEGFSGMTRGEAWYKPMLEVVEYLQANNFDVYVVTATERNIVRAIVAGTLDIEPSHVIGTEYGYVATGQGDKADADYTFVPGDKIVFDGSYEGENAKTSKVDAIVREIGKQPVIAFGNSSGDEAMLNYALANDSYSSASFMVLDDDAEREYGDAEGAKEKRDKWEGAGYTIFSMHDDFATIYGNGVAKSPVTS